MSDQIPQTRAERRRAERELRTNPIIEVPKLTGRWYKCLTCKFKKWATERPEKCPNCKAVTHE